MGTACSEPQIPLDRNYNPYANMNPPPINKSLAVHSQNLTNKIVSALENKNYSSKVPIESVNSHDIGVSPIQPFISAPVIEIPELETSIIRTENYMETLNTAMQQQEAARQAFMQQQAMMYAHMEQERRMRMEQEKQLAIQKQKQAVLAQHGPAPGTANPAELPPVTQGISERRKQLKMMKYQGQAKGVMLNPFKFTNNGVIYFGQWNNGHPHGKGLIYFPDGSVFQGGFFEGKPNGKGRLINQNGDYYEGTVSGNSASGIGISQNSLVRYEGEFQNNIPHGQGVQTSLDGKSIFKGRFHEGNKVAGTLIWGEKGQYNYEGQFVNNLFEGKGVLNSTGGVYIGDFRHGQKSGNGKYQWHDNRVYTGEYQNDMKNGYGELYNPDGTLSYRGEWKNDYPNGKGTTIANGVETTGMWQEGHFIG